MGGYDGLRIDQQIAQTQAPPGFAGETQLAQLQLVNLLSAAVQCQSLAAKHACGDQQRQAHDQQHGNQRNALLTPTHYSPSGNSSTRRTRSKRPTEN